MVKLISKTLKDKFSCRFYLNYEVIKMEDEENKTEETSEETPEVEEKEEPSEEKEESE